MMIFAISSIPLFFLFIIDSFSSRKIIYFFTGIVTSLLLTTLMWSIGTLFPSISDDIYSKTFNYSVVYIFPLIILFSSLIITNVKYSINIPESFIFGFLYWVMVFSLLLNVGDKLQINFIILPVIFMIILYFYHNLNFFSFKKNEHIFKNIIILSIPFVILISFILLEVSTVMLFSFVALLIAISLFVKIKLIK